MRRGSYRCPRRAACRVDARALAAMGLLLSTLLGCSDVAWTDVASGPKSNATQWYAAGAATVVGPDGLEQYAEQGSALFAAHGVVGWSVPLPHTTLGAGDSGQPTVWYGGGEAALMLRPQRIELQEASEVGWIRAVVTFGQSDHPVDLLGAAAGCRMSVRVPTFTITVPLEAIRDLAGHVDFVSDPELMSVSIGAPVVSLAPDCPALPALAELAGASPLDGALVAAVEAELLHGGDFGAVVEDLVRTASGATAPGRLDLDTGDGALSVVVTPNSSDGVEPVILAAKGHVALPLRVGLAVTPATCAAELPALPSKAPPAPPLPELDAIVGSGQAGFALRTDLLSTLLGAAARAGGLCIDGDDQLTLGDIRSLFPVDRVPFDDATPIVVRARPVEAPELTLDGDSAPTARIVIPAMDVALYLRSWDLEFRLWAGRLENLTASGLIPTLAGGGMIRLVDGTWTADGPDGPAVAEVLRRILSPSVDGLPLFVLPKSFPYRLEAANFRQVGSHLVVSGTFREQAPVALDGRHGAIAPGSAADAAGGTPMAGCHASSGRPSGAPAGLVLLATLLLGGLLRTRLVRSRLLRSRLVLSGGPESPQQGRARRVR